MSNTKTKTNLKQLLEERLKEDSRPITKADLEELRRLAKRADGKGKDA